MQVALGTRTVHVEDGYAGPGLTGGHKMDTSHSNVNTRNLKAVESGGWTGLLSLITSLDLGAGRMA